MATTHSCPGCGNAGIPRSMFACKPCWYRLPKPLRDDINHGWRHDREMHREAMVEAMSWYADNQPSDETRSLHAIGAAGVLLAIAMVFGRDIAIALGWV